MTDRPPPPDQGARDRIRTDLDHTLFVEAGAGSGKTTALIDRVKSLVTARADPSVGTEPVPMSAIAAITFTEKAGAELRERLRQELERAVARATEPAEVEACQHALDELDGAAIGTLHSFAQRILSEHPVEAGLPPRVEVLDEITSGVQFERRWAAFSDDLFEDPEYARTLLLLFAAGTRDTTPHALARRFNDNWDLVEDLVPEKADAPGPMGPVLDDVIAQVQEVCDLMAECVDEGDQLCERLGEIDTWLDAVKSAADEAATVEALRTARELNKPSFRVSNRGKRDCWRVPVDRVRSEVAAAGDAIDRTLSDIATACAHHLGSAIRRFTLESAAERRHAGTLEFHDLLVLARSLLRHPDHGAGVRRALHDRYQRLLLDEFQDTDPIQIELAVRIAAADPESAGAGAAPWEKVEVGPGRLFVVGDPKQSIYRFRRADISLFLRAARRFAPAPDDAVTLTANFRTASGGIDWVNHVFARLLSEGAEDGRLLDSQPDYVALDAVRPDPPIGPPVSVLGRNPHEPGTKAGELRAAEAAEVVSAIRRAMDERWQVDEDHGGWRDPRLGDVAILVPARTSLPYLEDALTDAGIAYRAEASSLVYASRVVRDLLMVVRAVADPTDHLRIVSALRTPLFGCGDDDLYRFKVERRGHWGYLGEQPETVPHDDPVAAGLAAMAQWHHDRTWISPSALLEAIVRDRRALELAIAGGRPRDAWRRIRFVIDQARAWSDATGGNLRAYLDWVAQQTVEGARVAEAILPETDDDAVRIMTIHAAKGLEFPITIVSGMSSAPGAAAKPGDVRFPESGVAYYLGKHAETPEFTATRPVDEQMSFDERVRLLYVATTRAKDHLVISLHRATRRGPLKSHTTRTNAELLVDGIGELLTELPDATGEIAPVTPAPPSAAPPPIEPFDEWKDSHTASLAAASRPTTVAATALTDEGGPDVDEWEAPDEAELEPSSVGARAEPAQLTLDFRARPAPTDLDVSPDGVDAGLRKRPGDLDRPPWLKGRYGTSVGRAVHGVLQTIELSGGADGAEVGGAVAAQCQAEAVPDRAGTVRRLVSSALTSPSVAEAAASPHWREVYACTPVGDRLLEGYVDLLYRCPEGLVVVDYKTAATRDPGELDRRVAGYRMQGASYAVAVGASTGEPVVRVTFLFLTPDGAVERHLADLPAAIAEVEAAVAAGSVTELA